MKFRNGFVSNSSSSSFIASFSKKPDNEEELMEMMFPGKSRDDHICAYDDVIHIGQCIDSIFNQIQEQKNVTIEDITEIFNSGYNEFLCGASRKDIEKYDLLKQEEKRKNNEYWKKYHDIRSQLGIEPMNELPKKTKKNAALLNELDKIGKDRTDWIIKHYDKIDTLTNKMAKDSAKKFMKENSNKWIGIFSYSDNDGSFGSVMEHGDVFRNLDYMRISHH